MVDTRVYDGADRLIQSGPANAIDRYYAQALYGTNANGTANPGSGTETHLNRFDDNGRLLFQRVWDAGSTGSTGKTDTSYEGGYDAAGNLKSYSVFDYASSATNSYQMALDRRETYKQTSTSGSGTRSQPGASHSHYNVNGNLTAITDDTQPSNNRTLVNDISGKALQVSQSGNIQRQLVLGGEVLARYGVGIDEVNPRDTNGNPNFAPIGTSSGGSVIGAIPGQVRNGADFNFGYQPINGNYPSASAGSYQVATGDTLQTIAQGAYGDSSLWYRIADANGLASNADLRVGQTLSIPNRVGTVHNYGANSAVGGASGTGSFKPYDPSKVQGDSTPNLPAPQAEDGGCGGLGQILIIIVAIVVTVYTAGAASGFVGGFAQTMAAGAGVLGGSAGVGAAIGYGIVGGAVGSIASQAVGIAIGVQTEFSWKGVALAAIGGAVSGGLGASGAFSGLGAAGSVITRAAVGNALTQGIAVVTGLQDQFSWKGVAAAAVGAGVSFGIGQALGADAPLPEGQQGPLRPAAFAQFGQAGDVLRSSLTGFAAGLATAAARGGRVSITQVATDAFGQALGESFKDGLVSAGQQEMALRDAHSENQREMNRFASGAATNLANSPGAASQATALAQDELLGGGNIRARGLTAADFASGTQFDDGAGAMNQDWEDRMAVNYGSKPQNALYRPGEEDAALIQVADKSNGKSIPLDTESANFGIVRDKPGEYVKQVKDLLKSAPDSASTAVTVELVEKYGKDLKGLVKQGVGSSMTGSSKADGFANNSYDIRPYPEEALNNTSNLTYHKYGLITYLGPVDQELGIDKEFVRKEVLEKRYGFPGKNLEPAPANIGGNSVVFAVPVGNVIPSSKLDNPNNYTYPIGVITQERVPDGIVNITTEKHDVYPGTIRRTVVEVDGHLFMYTSGAGENRYNNEGLNVRQPAEGLAGQGFAQLVTRYAAAAGNDNYGPLAFRALDRQAVGYLNTIRAKR